jgi:MFS family permease
VRTPTPSGSGDAIATHGRTSQGRGLRGALFNLRTFDALHYPEFRLLWFSQASLSLATWMDQVARGWLLYQLTSSPLQLGLVRGFQAIPLLFLSPIAGTAADRYDRKVQMIIAQILDGLMYAAIAVLIITGLIEPWHVYATAFAGGVVQTFQNPARLAMVADVVPPNHLTNAIALSSVLFNLARMVGPAVAGLLIAFVGTEAAYGVEAGLYFIATAWTVKLPDALRHPLSSDHAHRRRASFVRSVVDGWKISWTIEEVRAGLLITGLASLFIIPFTTLLPVFAKDILDVGASGQGFLLTAMGVGAFCSAVLIATLGDQLPRGMLMLAGVTLYGLAVAIFAASGWFQLSVALMAVVGLFHVSSHALVQTVVQTYSPAEFRGRTGGIFQQSHVLLMLGSLVLGGLATVLGAQWAMAAMGLAGAVAMIAIFLLMPIAKRIR